MKITRDGKEIELTDREVQEAWEVQHKLNLEENILNLLNGTIDKEGNDVVFTEEEMEEAIDISEYYLDKEWDRGSSLLQAIDDVLEAR